MDEENKIETLPKHTSQLANWQFNETVVEKINELILKINLLATTEEIDDEEEKNAENENENQENQNENDENNSNSENENNQ